MASMKKDSFFNSSEFQNFLKDNNALLKKQTNSPSLSEIFKSGESFSNIFSSMNWQMDKAELVPSISSNSITEEDRFRSKDWLTLKNLGNHVDAPYYSHEMLEECGECQQQEEQQQQPQPQEEASKTNWGDFFYAQLHPPAAATAADDAFRISAPPPPPPQAQDQQNNVLEEPATRTKSTSPKRKRKPRKKIDPPVKEYVDPTDVDILLGRGGKSNHHPGNKRYREEIKNFQSSYLELENKDDKTDLSRFVIDHVHQYKGRFLSLDKEVNPNRWYVTSDVVARRKVSQALREDDDPVKRAQKRARFLDRKMTNKKKAS